MNALSGFVKCIDIIFTTITQGDLWKITITIHQFTWLSMYPVSLNYNPYKSNLQPNVVILLADHPAKCYLSCFLVAQTRQARKVQPRKLEASEDPLLSSRRR